MFYEIVKIVVPFYDGVEFSSMIRYKVKINGGESVPMTFVDEDKAIEYIDYLISKAGER